MSKKEKKYGKGKNRTEKGERKEVNKGEVKT